MVPVSVHVCPQVLIATSTLAWGVNFPAHLVVVKGTEYYDGKSRRYVDYPITGTQSGVFSWLIQYSVFESTVINSLEQVPV